MRQTVYSLEIKFSVDRYKVMHMGKKHNYIHTIWGLNYFMNNRGRNLVVTDSLKTTAQCKKGKRNQK